MLDRTTLKRDFNKYVLDFYQVHKHFTFEEFGDFATTLLNYYVNAQIIESQDKMDAAYYLTTLYNKGMGNRITEDDMTTIARVIARDYSFNMQVLEKILG